MFQQHCKKARTWDEGVSSNFATTPLKDIFKDKKVVIFGHPGGFMGVCSLQHVPSYKKQIDKFKAKGIDSVICVAVNDPYVMNGWANKLEAKDSVTIYRARQWAGPGQVLKMREKITGRVGLGFLENSKSMGYQWPWA